MTSNKLMMVAVVFAIGAMGFVDVNGMDSTEGKLKLPDGTFRGTIEQGRSAHGRLYYKTDSKKQEYDGPLVNSVPHGKLATLRYRNGDLFCGQFALGEPIAGMLTYRNGNVYKGEFEGNLPNGKGKPTYAKHKNIKEYDGTFSKGVPHGSGCLTFKDGKSEWVEMVNGLEMKVGEYKKIDSDKVTGLYLGNGKKYTGAYKKAGDGRILPAGGYRTLLYFSNGDSLRDMNLTKGKIIKSNFLDDNLLCYRENDEYQRHSFRGEYLDDGDFNCTPSKGSLEFNNGDLFEGTFENGLPKNGTLKYKNHPNRIEYKGDFSKCLPHGAGILKSRGIDGGKILENNVRMEYGLIYHAS